MSHGWCTRTLRMVSHLPQCAHLCDLELFQKHGLDVAWEIYASADFEKRETLQVETRLLAAVWQPRRPSSLHGAAGPMPCSAFSQVSGLLPPLEHGSLLLGLLSLGNSNVQVTSTLHSCLGWWWNFLLTVPRSLWSAAILGSFSFPWDLPVYTSLENTPVVGVGISSHTGWRLKPLLLICVGCLFSLTLFFTLEQWRQNPSLTLQAVVRMKNMGIHQSCIKLPELKGSFLGPNQESIDSPWRVSLGTSILNTPDDHRLPLKTCICYMSKDNHAIWKVLCFQKSKTLVPLHTEIKNQTEWCWCSC